MNMFFQDGKQYIVALILNVFVKIYALEHNTKYELLVHPVEVCLIFLIFATSARNQSVLVNVLHQDLMENQKLHHCT